MDNDPEGEEQLPEQWAPRAIAVVDGIRDPCHNPNHVEDDEGGGRDEKSGPLEEVELPELCIICSLGCDSEVGVNSCKHLEEALEDCKEMSGDTSYDPELLIPPPVLDADSAPPELKYACGNDGEEEGKEPNAGQVGELSK